MLNDCQDAQLWDWFDPVDGSGTRTINTVQSAQELGRRIRRAGLHLTDVEEVWDDYSLPLSLKKHAVAGYKEEDRILHPSHRFYPTI